MQTKIIDPCSRAKRTTVAGLRKLTRVRLPLLAAVATMAALSVTQAATPTLTGQDVGALSLAGSMTTAAGKTTIIGGGSDIWNNSDNFYYAFFKVTGDFDYVVQIEDLQGPDAWTKAELMARLDDGSGVPQGGDPHISNMTTRSAGQNELRPQWRTARDGVSDNWAISPAVRPTYPNTWLRLERIGSAFYQYYSVDGKVWNQYTVASGAAVNIDTAGSAPPGGDNATSFNSAWPSALLLGMAVTAHNDADLTGGIAVISNFSTYTPVPIAITTQPAATLSVSANKPLVLTVAATGDPIHYQWRKNGTAIAGATAATYTIPLAQTTDAGTYSVRLFASGREVISGNSVVSVTQDTEAPKIAKASGDVSFTSLLVTFSEPVTATAENKANYSLDKGITITSVTRIDPATVNLTISKMADGTDYTLTVNAIQDTAIPANTIAANSKLTFKSWVFATGFVLQKFWDNFTANTIAGLIADARFPNAPTSVTIEPMWEYGPNGLNESGSNYGNQLVGWFTPATSGNYVFFTNSDDSSNLFLSTDDTAANKKLIAQETGWSNARNWVAVGSGDVTSKRSDQFGGTEWPNGNTITLQAGRRYYLESLHAEGGGGDSVAATFIKEGAADPANNDAPALTGALIGTYLDPSGASVNVSQQPQNATVQDGLTGTFTAAATGISAYGSTVSYQWQKAAKGSTSFSNITGATTATYKTPVLALADDGTQYRVVATVPTQSVNSDAATVKVVPDTFAPVITAGALPSSTAGTAEVGVGFDEAVDRVSASLASNYSISAGTITSVTYYTNSQSALLKVSGLAAGATATVTVKNVADVKGNKITTATAPITVSSTMKWGVVGASELGKGNWVVPVSTTGFDIYSDSIGEWGTYDEATFVYEQVTGDFDKVLRVEYQENSSQWGRAGLIVRDVLNFGVDRATQDAGAAGRYQKCHVNPVGPTMTGPGTAGNGAWEGNRRLATGAATTSVGGGGAPVPYPNAWCRIKRTGQAFEIFRSSDAVTWTSMGVTTFDTAMPATLYVGPEFAPENGNVTNEADRTTWLVKIRDYGDFKVASAAAKFTKIAKNADGSITIEWTGGGTLQAGASVTGPWQDVAGATSPYTLKPSSAALFGRIKN